VNINEQEYRGVPAGSLIILRALVGSTVHGTSVANTDDRDEMAIVVEPVEYRVGLKNFETTVYRTQPEGVRSGPGDLDLVIHSLNKFATLAAKGNPTILLPLYVQDKDIIHIHHFGKLLREHRSMFTSKDSGFAFLGYMEHQRQRMTGERGQMRVKRQELIDAYGFDTKYVGHVIRLAHQGIELMSTGHLSLPMKPEQAGEVVDIRTGKYTLPQVVDRARDLESDLREAIDRSEAPEHADYSLIDKTLRTVYLQSWVPGVFSESESAGNA